MRVIDAPAIATYNLTKSYGANRGIRDVNLRVERGEIFGFLGPNGAGKSTTLRTILGFMRPTGGRAEVLGMDSQHQTVEIHRRLGNLPSEFSLWDRMTGAEMLRLFVDLRGGDIPLDYAHELAERLDADLTRPMRRLSRGNKQKIGIIQALYHQPPVIILDEPTSGLDPLMRDVFLDILRETRDRGQTVFFSSHILPEVEQVADRVGVIREGELVAIEDPQALTSKGFRYVRITMGDDEKPPHDARMRRIRHRGGRHRRGLPVRASASDLSSSQMRSEPWPGRSRLVLFHDRGFLGRQILDRAAEHLGLQQQLGVGLGVDRAVDRDPTDAPTTALPWPRSSTTELLPSFSASARPSRDWRSAGRSSRTCRACRTPAPRDRRKARGSASAAPA